jgi:aspartate aminotransferase-like enzyme
VLNADCFRIGSIGDIHPSDMRSLLTAIKHVIIEMNMTLK